jgi:hypothetical protein
LDRCGTAINEVADRTSGRVVAKGYVEIYSYWKHWHCLFPQHGPGRKHERLIRLEDWQKLLVQRHAPEFIMGLIHSDGCRIINRVKGHEYPRYFFSNRSAELRGLFMRACAVIGVESRPSNRYTISVAKRRSVTIMDVFIGPKG